MRLTLAGQRYHYLDEGSGPVLLMVHGNPTWSFYWRNLILALRDRYRVVAVDHIGCGLSDKPPASEYPYRLARRVADLGELIEKLELRQITLVAHDWGGAIGMGAAVAAPERFARFVLMNTAAFRMPQCPWPIRLCHLPRLGPLAVQGLNLFVRAALRTTVCKPERMTAAVKAGYWPRTTPGAHRVAVLRFVLDIPLADASELPDAARSRRDWPSFAEHPVCLIWGMRDWCFTPAVFGPFSRFLSRRPRCIGWPTPGHYVVEDAHEQIGPLVEDFVQRHPP